MVEGTGYQGWLHDLDDGGERHQIQRTERIKTGGRRTTGRTRGGSTGSEFEAHGSAYFTFGSRGSNRLHSCQHQQACTLSLCAARFWQLWRLRRAGSWEYSTLPARPWANW